MNQHNPISNFTPAQTPQAAELQAVALWVAERIGTGIGGEEAATLRNTLLAVAANVESVELTMIDALHKVMDMADERKPAEPTALDPALMVLVPGSAPVLLGADFGSGPDASATVTASGEVVIGGAS